MNGNTNVLAVYKSIGAASKDLPFIFGGYTSYQELADSTGHTVQ